MDAMPPLGMLPRREAGGLTPPAARLVRSLSLGVFLQWAGAGAILPLLPLYVRGRGGSDVVVGGVMAGFFATAFVFEYGAGRLADRWSRVPVVVAGMAVDALGTVLFLLPGPAALDVVFRALQGAGAGASGVAALAMITRAVPMSHRGRAVGRIYGAQLGGLAIGPVFGSVAGLGAMRALFVAAAVALVVAIVPVLRAEPPAGVDPVAAREATGGPRSGERPDDRRGADALTGTLLAGALIGLTTGVYESCWTLLLTRHGAAQWEIGLSWTLFALPFALMSRPGGWLADHLDRRWLAVGAIGWAAAFCAGYPFLPSVVLLLALGVAEACGAAVAFPACQSLLGEGTSAGYHGRAQGLFAASQTGATAVAAACAGVLFSTAPWLPFVSVAGICVAGMALVAFVWRKVPGRVVPRVGSAVAGSRGES